MTYQRLRGMSQREFNDDMFDCYRHMVTYDMPRVREVSKAHANQFTCKMDTLSNGWIQVDSLSCPENYGFNVVALPVPQPGKRCRLSFEGEAGIPGYNAVNVDKAGWRYGFVGVKADGTPLYGEKSSDSSGQIVFKAPKGEPLSHLWLVVMGAPTEHWSNGGGRRRGGNEAPV